MTTMLDPSMQAAVNGGMPDSGAPGFGYTPGQASTQTQAQATPATATGVGGATTPSATPTQANPLQPAYLPTPPQAQPTSYTAATYQNNYNPQTATSELNQAAGVQDQAQNQQLMSMLAAQGISPGSSAAQAAMQNLSGAQTAALAPSLVSAQQYGAGLNEQSGLANQGSLNTAGQFGAGAANTMTSQNLQDLLQSQEFNAGAYNTAGQQQAGYQNNDWLAQLQAQLGLQQTGLGTSGSLAGDQANQTVPLNPSLFSQISSGVGSAASAAAPFSGGSGGGGTPGVGAYNSAAAGGINDFSDLNPYYGQ